MSAIKTSLVMPCYCPTEEHVEMTRRALEGLRDFGRPDEIILVDDGSPIKYDFPRLVDTMIWEDENKGFPKTVNIGWKATRGGIIITANNDLTFVPGWLEGILLPLEHNYDISSILVSDQEDFKLTEEIEDDAKFGSLWAQKRRVYEDLGGFDERYGRGYFEDLDYRRQALNKGYRIGKYHGAIVEHIGRATYSVLDPKQELYKLNYQVFLDKWGFME